MVRKLGIPPENLDPLRYAGPRFNLTPVVESTRRPAVYDRIYSLFTFWRVAAPVSGLGEEGEMWYLARFADNGEVGLSPGDAVWIMLSQGGSGPAVSFETDDGPPNVEPDALGEIQIFGGAGINVTGQGPGNTITVSLEGGGVAIDQIDVDFSTAPGVDPVDADANGLIAISGNTVANATNLNSPVATHTRALNAFDIDVQLSTAVAPTPGDVFDVGLSSFNNTQFTVDVNGFVSLIGSNLPVLQTLTGDDATAIGPDANGNIDIHGMVVANATNSKPLYFDGTAVSNLLEAELQVAAAITGAPADTNDAGIASFDDTQFTVDANGFVQLSGIGPINPLAVITLWDDFFNTQLGSTGDDNPIIGWNAVGAVNYNPTATASSSHPGIVSLGVSGVSDNFIVTNSANDAPVVVGGGEITLTWIARHTALSTAGNPYIAYIGFLNAVVGVTNGIYFSYTHSVNSGNWVVNTTSASVTTSSNSSIAADTDWHKFVIVVNAAGTSVDFFIDDVQAGSTISTNIPTAPIGLCLRQNRNGGAGTASLLGDLVIYKQTLTTSR